MNTPAKNYKAIMWGFPIIGLLLLGAISWTIDIGVRHSNSEQTGKVNNIVNHSIDPQLIVFGSSVSEVGVNAPLIRQKTGLSVYNCSMNGTRFMQYKGLIDEFNGYSKNNQYVVLVETYFSFEKTDALAYIDRYLAQIGNHNLYSSLYEMQPGLVWKCRYVPFYKYVAATHVYYKNSAIGWKNIVRKTPADTALGYAPVDASWQLDADEAIKNTPHFDISIDSAIVTKYMETIGELEKSGRKVIIVMTPMYTEMLQRVTDMAPLRRRLREISASTGARFLDFSANPLCDQKKFFYNSNHLNLQGSVAFSQVLADSLQLIIKPRPGALAGSQ